jgi:hypothetical protein
MAATRIWETNTMAQILALAREVLAGEIAMEDGGRRRAIGHFEAAVRLEDALTYVEPSDWYVPARHNLGARPARRGRPAERRPSTARISRSTRTTAGRWQGWSRVCSRRERASDAKALRLELEQVWSRADVEIEGSRL